MPAPQIIDHNLVDGAPINLTLRIDFDTELDQSSIGHSSILLTAASSATQVIRGTFTYEALGAGGSRVTFLPDYALDQNTTYRLDVTPSLKASDDTPAVTQTLHFTTGDSISEPIKIGLPTGQLWSEATGQIGEFRLLRSTPANRSWNINTNPQEGNILTQIVLVFSEALDPNQWPANPESWEDLSDLINIEVESIDGTPNIKSRIPDISSVNITMDMMSITLETSPGQSFNTSWDPEAQEIYTEQDMTFLANNLIVLTLSENIRNAQGTTRLGTPITLHFSTELFPKYGTIKSVFSRYEMVSSILDLDDREKDYMIWRESAWLADMLVARKKSFRIDLPTRNMRDYVQYKVLWDIVNEAISIQAASGDVQDKQLGPFRVTKTFTGNAKVVQRYMNELEARWRNHLEALLPLNWFLPAIRGLNSPYRRFMQPNAMFARRTAGHEGHPTNPWGWNADVISQ